MLPAKAEFAPSAADKAFPSRIPSLDGIRAVAILLVVFAHLCGTRGFLPEATLAYTGDLGRRGVQIFFVLSGFLITSLLISELRGTGWISLKAFYIRRAFRIMPAAYCYIGAMLVLTLLGVLPISARGMIAASTYTINYWGAGRTWYLGHLWSLSVEEQFYFAWPSVLALLGARIARRVVVAAAVFGCCFRVVAKFCLPPQSISWFPTVMDALAVGCLLALIRADLERSDRYRRYLHSAWGLVCPLAAILGIQIVRRPDALLSLPFSIAIAALIHRVASVPTDALGRLLNARPVAWVGTVSYSLYLWQQAFVFRDAPHSRFPLNLALALFVAVVSHYAIERPLLRIGRRASQRIKPL
jgi:peptidoglycan/LPS O-acetylase OafA/YrhL